MEENGVLAVCGYEIEKICSFYSLPVGTFVKAIFCAPSHFHMVMLWVWLAALGDASSLSDQGFFRIRIRLFS